MKTLYLSDLDGTFLNSNGEISCASAEIISDLAAKGVLFTVATARTHATVMQMFSDIPLSCPLVLMNGVTIYNPIERKIISCNDIPTDLGNRILKELRDRDIYPMLYFQNGDALDIYYSRITNDYQKEYVANRTDCPGKRFIKTDSPVSIEDKKLIYIVCLERYEKLKEAYEAVEALGDAHCMFYRDNYSDMYFLEIISKAVSKGSAAKQVKELIGADRMVAFGDNLNDIPLFEAADECYAVGNAENALKEIATDVIGSNDEDAVAKYILNEYNRQTS